MLMLILNLNLFWLWTTNEKLINLSFVVIMYLLFVAMSVCVQSHVMNGTCIYCIWIRNILQWNLSKI